MASSDLESQHFLNGGDEQYDGMEYQTDDVNVDAKSEQQMDPQVEIISIGGRSSKMTDAPEFYEEEPVTLNRLEEVLAMEHGLKLSCKTLPITTALWVFFTLLMFFHGQVHGSFQCVECITNAMTSINVPAVNSTLRTLSLGNITERYDIIQWIRLGMVPALTDSGLAFGQLRRTQQLIGKVRIEQVRSTPQNCEFNSKLANFHPMMCHPPGGDAQAYGTTKLDYKMAYEPYTIGSGTSGKFVSWLDIGRDSAVVTEEIQSLLEFDWLDDNSQEVLVEAMFLNVELNVFSMLQIHFVLHRGGWIQQDISVYPLRGDVYYSWGLIFADIIWLTFVALLIWQALAHAYDEYKHGLIYYWATDVFTILDWVGVGFSIVVAVYFAVLATQLDSFTSSANGLGFMPAQNGIDAAMSWKTRYILQNWQYDKDTQTLFDSFNIVREMTDWHRFIALLYNSIQVLRFFRGFEGQPRIAVLLQTINQVQNFLIHYVIIFVVCMASFMVAGYLLLGEQLGQWSTLGKATGSCFRLLFGKFDYEEFYDVAPISATIWFFSFLIVMVFLLLGVLTAAILHQYLTVRSEVGETGVSIVKQGVEAWYEFLYGRTYDGAQKSIPPDKLFEMVTKDTDRLRLRQLARCELDRRLRTRSDVHEAEIDPKVDIDFLIGRGMDEVTANRMLQRVAEAGHNIAMRSDPQHRLTLFLVRQMAQLRYGATHMRKKTGSKVTWAARAVDRLDLKHAKCAALARRLRRAQQLPVGWTMHTDSEGRQYLRQEQSGLVSWTLPRHLI